MNSVSTTPSKGGRSFQGLLSLARCSERTPALPAGMPKGPAAWRITKRSIRGTIVAPCRKRSAQGEFGSSLAT